MESRNSNNFRGIDVSNWQGNIDFAKVKQSGIQIVYMKATEGTTFVDKKLNQNYSRAKAQGLKIGFYHFFRPSLDSKAQAKHFANTINGKVSDCKLALDLEVADNFSKSALTDKALTFINELKSLTGLDIVVYTYTYFARTNIDSRLGVYPLWIAHYGVLTPGSNPIWNSWVGFQYSSTGSVPGVSGNCDMNEFKEEILDVKNNFKLYNATTKNVSTYLNIREKGEIDSKIIGKIPAGEEFMIKWVDSNYLGWYLIEYKNITGYVSSKYVEKFQMATTYNVSDFLNVRERGTTDSKVVAIINAGEIFRIDWVDSDYIGWYRITTKYGKNGFVKADFVKKI